MFTLRKLELEKGKESTLPTGYTSRGHLLHLFKLQEPKENIDGAALSDVKEGFQLLLIGLSEWHSTSKISEIISKEDSKVVFKTQTSIYELVEE